MDWFALRRTHSDVVIGTTSEDKSPVLTHDPLFITAVSSFLLFLLWLV
jgi:hypothetical protein